MSSVVLIGLAGLVVFAGAIVQGGAGLGMNLLAAPLLTLIDRVLVPVPLLVASLLLAAMAMRREHRHIDWRGTGFAVAGRIPGTAVGVLAVALLPVREFSITIGALVLACLVLSVVAWRPRPTPAALLTAGFAGGAMGTASSIGAPPLALLYQHKPGPTIRATLSAYIVFGSCLSLAALALGGQIGAPELYASLLLLPFMAAGFALSGPLRRYLDGGWMRPCLLALAALSALVLIVRWI